MIISDDFLNCLTLFFAVKPVKLYCVMID